MGHKVDTGLDNKRIGINMIFSVVAFLLNLLINFFITPYITSNFGSEAYGFVKLANDFASYISIFSIALNSMSSRFIMLKRTQGDEESARKYYTSITVANIILVAILLVPITICVVFLDRFLEISLFLVLEVKITFAITFINLIINLIFSVYGNCYYLTNRLDISSIRTAQSNIIKVACILLLFFSATPRISYVALGTLLASVYLIITNFYFSRKLTPDLRFHMKYFEVSKVREVLSSGVWNSITRLSQIFSSGLDLLVTNLLIGPEMMGYLSVSKTVPNIITSFNATIANVFSPNLMLIYAQGDISRLKKATKSAMKFMCLFVSIPNAILISMGTEFFTLWVPDQPAKLINILSILTVVNSCITGPIQPLYQIFTITNKIKQSSIVMIIYGFSSILITYICLKTTNLGLYAVAGVSMIGSIAVALFFHIPYAAKYIDLPWNTFFPEIGKGVLSMFSVVIVGKVIVCIINIQNSWLAWFTGAFVTALIGLSINIFLVLDKEERTVFWKMIRDKVKRK